jgi:hypothetical protein
VGSEEASWVVLLLPSTPFLYLSPESLSQGGNPFLRTSSQDSSPFLPDSALRVDLTPEYQASLAAVASEAETVSWMESDGAELPPGQFQLARSRHPKRRRLELSTLRLVIP